MKEYGIGRRNVMRIGVDIDGTIKDTHRAAVEVYNKELNRSVRVEDVTDFYLDQAYGLTPREGRKLWRKLEDQIYSLGIPLNHSVEVLNELVRMGHEIYFITARPGMRKIVDVTKEWLKKHGFPYNGDNLIMNAQDKGKVAKEIGIELFFEDAPNHLLTLLQNRIPTIIVDAVYNRDFPHPLRRIHDWREVYEIVDAKKQESHGNHSHSNK
ncbi:hypothetical protein ACFO25_08160 [Paenactinomyces guangxiensis]|uniref:Nucleotidase n=1 Tax=Paenactinomyces guangxiensis TaxID=1490290 RepID=A0A7W1WN77_9BACL|nr:hypothetical protein [Paenactinomyces guangxiensis]MBA4492982.1 hypothetical protein [Paenactinomyces guangxiensis]MBH8590169.1 hypothetical protein [Paenactinomyces guangxiensis]